MKEIKIATLDKDDLKIALELKALEGNINESMIEFRSKHIAAWELWRRKYKLDFAGHYIKGKAIYKQVV